jgi:hypothetical protein
MSAGWTVPITVVSGVFVFVVGQAVQRFLLEPIQQQRRVIGQVAFALLYYGNVGLYKPFESESREDIASTLRKLAGELRRTRSTIPVYRLLEKTRLVPKTDNVIKASAHLTGWSNSIIGGSEDTAAEHKDIIRFSLDIVR